MVTGCVLVVIGSASLFSYAYLGWLRRRELTSGGVVGQPGETDEQSHARNRAINDRQMSTAQRVRPLALGCVALGVGLVVASAIL
jgi:hypothetical protein